MQLLILWLYRSFTKQCKQIAEVGFNCTDVGGIFIAGIIAGAFGVDADFLISFSMTLTVCSTFSAMSDLLFGGIVLFLGGKDLQNGVIVCLYTVDFGCIVGREILILFPNQSLQREAEALPSVVDQTEVVNTL